MCQHHGARDNQSMDHLSPHTRINWAAPWLAPYRTLGERVQAHWDSGLALPQALNLQTQASVRFVPQQALPEGEAFEAFTARTNQVPTRENLHDFFNGLCWLVFPRTKQRLNQCHAVQIARHGIGPARGAVRDACTVLDENGAFLQCPDALWAALKAKDWQRLFITQRPLWEQATLLLFGHALLEKLLLPRKPVTAHVYRAVAASNSIVDIDHWLAVDLQDGNKLIAQPFTPLPVLGVPGWWSANADPTFYADTSVFRPAPTTPQLDLKFNQSPLPSGL